MLRYILKIVGLWVAGVIAFAMLVNNAHAGEFFGVVTVGSRHLGDTHGYRYNEKNYGLGIEYQGESYRSWLDLESACGVSGGFYENSYRRTTVYGLAFCGYTVYSVPDVRVRLGSSLGLASGYRLPGGNLPHIGAFVPVVNIVGELMFPKPGIGSNLVYVPKGCSDCNAVIGLQLKFETKKNFF